jgi:uncharacterized protein (TIGR00251 family)
VTQRVFVTTAISPSVDPNDWRTALRPVGEDGISLDIYVEPGASTASFGPYDPWRQRIKVRVTAPATEGRANTEMASIVGDVLGTSPRSLRIARGATTRRKTVIVEGVGPETAEEALATLLGEGAAQR